MNTSWRTFNKNLDDALHIYKHIDELPHFKKVWVRKSIVHNYIHAIIIVFKRLYTFFDQRRNLNSLPLDSEIILYVNSNNTYHSLEFLKNDTSIFLEQSNRIHPYSSPLGSEMHNMKTSPWLLVLSVVNFPLFVLLYWWKVLKYPNLYFENWGKDYVNKRMLKRFDKTKKVVFANDHNVENRLFKVACESLGIKTIYLQHASITKLFPELDFDESYLFGQVDLEKYQQVGQVSGKVELVGSPKFDHLFSLRRTSAREVTKVVGLALNLIDQTDQILSLIDKILTNTSYQIEVRMHPGDKRVFEIPSERVYFHSARDKKLSDFFEGIDFLIAGESSIHLESQYINIPSIYANLTATPSKDQYQFVSKGLLQEVNLQEIDEVAFESYSKLNINKNVLKAFVHSVGENYDGNSRMYITNQILHL